MTANSIKDECIRSEVSQLTPEQAIAWCEALSIDWQSFDVNRVKAPITWVKALQIRANEIN